MHPMLGKVSQGTKTLPPASRDLTPKATENRAPYPTNNSALA